MSKRLAIAIWPCACITAAFLLAGCNTTASLPNADDATGPAPVADVDDATADDGGTSDGDTTNADTTNTDADGTDPSGDGDTSDPTDDSPTSDDNGDTTDADTEPSDPVDDNRVVITDETAQQAAEEAIAATARAIIAVSPVSDMQDIIEFGASSPACPQLTYDGPFENMSVDLSYDPACAPDNHPNLSVGGTISGVYYPVYGTIDFDITDLSCGVGTLSGGISGTFEYTSDGVQYSVSLQLRDDANYRITANAEATIITSDQMLVFSEATLSIESDDVATPFDADLADVPVDLSANALAAYDGTITLTTDADG